MYQPLLAVHYGKRLEQCVEDMGSVQRKDTSCTLTLINTEYWDRAGGGGNISYDW